MLNLTGAFRIIRPSGSGSCARQAEDWAVKVSPTSDAPLASWGRRRMSRLPAVTDIEVPFCPAVYAGLHVTLTVEGDGCGAG